MIYLLRTLVGCAALAGGAWALTSTASADTPDLPADSYKKAADADLKFLQTRLGELAKKGPVVASAAAAVVPVSRLRRVVSILNLQECF